MRYFDTSFLVPLILSEATSEPITAFLKNLSVGDWTVSHWTRVEYPSVIARHVRMNILDIETAHKANVKFDIIIGTYFAVLSPNRDDFDRAREYINYFETGLRAGDALHLAIAGNRGANAIYSLDKSFLSAGKQLGLPTTAGVALPGYEG